MKRFSYYRHHLPTGKTTIGHMDAENLAQVHATLNDYTRQGMTLGSHPPTWVYWTDPNEPGREIGFMDWYCGAASAR